MGIHCKTYTCKDWDTNLEKKKFILPKMNKEDKAELNLILKELRKLISCVTFEVSHSNNLNLKVEGCCCFSDVSGKLIFEADHISFIKKNKSKKLTIVEKILYDNNELLSLEDDFNEYLGHFFLSIKTEKNKILTQYNQAMKSLQKLAKKYQFDPDICYNELVETKV